MYVNIEDGIWLSFEEMYISIHQSWYEIDDSLRDLGTVPDINVIKRSLPNVKRKLFDIYNLVVHSLNSRIIIITNRECYRSCGAAAITKTGKT
jgi:hypothetical protein